MGYRAGEPLFCRVCGKRAIARRLCRTHYMQHWRNESLETHPKMSPDQSFNTRIFKMETCWLWMGSRNHAGYGIFLLPGEIGIRAHRYIYERDVGPIPKGMIILHSCDNPSCVNPKHLSVGTRRDNTRDAAKKRRLLFGERHHQAKLMTAQVEAIRIDPRRHADIAAEYGVAQSTISRIKTGARRSYE